MHVLVAVDMEGAAHLTDPREIWPAFPEYWRSGRPKLTADVVAAIEGVRAGGATEVTVVDGHGFNWRNVIAEALPADVDLRQGGVPADGPFDGVLQVGHHARCGTPDGFLSHTWVPDLRAKVDGAPITESHEGAWERGVPVLGVIGDAALGRQLDGALAGTPFLAVKRSTSLRQTTPVHADPATSAAAIRAFARDCTRAWRARPAPRRPEDATLEFSFRPDLTALAEGQAGLVRVSPAVLRAAIPDWTAGLRALDAVIPAAARPFVEAQDDLDLSSEAALAAQPPAKLARLRAYADWFTATDQPPWRD